MNKIVYELAMFTLNDENSYSEETRQNLIETFKNTFEIEE
jgi:hypothetical protein